MSASTPRATEIARRCNMPRRARNGLMQRSKQQALFDQLVGAIEQLSWDSEAA
jgi:hypothetical protein